jgi:hypothetical protein
MPALFLGVGAMLNLNKWISFCMRIRTFIQIGQRLHENEGQVVRINNSEVPSFSPVVPDEDSSDDSSSNNT